MLCSAQELDNNLGKCKFKKGQLPKSNWEYTTFSQISTPSPLSKSIRILYYTSLISHQEYLWGDTIMTARVGQTDWQVDTNMIPTNMVRQARTEPFFYSKMSAFTMFMIHLVCCLVCAQWCDTMMLTSWPVRTVFLASFSKCSEIRALSVQTPVCRMLSFHCSIHAILAKYFSKMSTRIDSNTLGDAPILLI